MNVLFFSAVGLGQAGLAHHRIHTPADGRWLELRVECKDDCPWCSLAPHSQFARGDGASLPVRLSAPPRVAARLGPLRRIWPRARTDRPR
jgi:hypothetical protein